MSAIKMENVTKIFGNFKANDNINLEVKKGEIHVLLGENGAGKSTLMNILFGLYKIDEGKIYINEEFVKISSPRDATNLGIGMVHQHFMLVDTFTVVENIILGREEIKNGKLYLKDSIDKLNELIKKYNFDLDVLEKVRNLTVGQKQRVEILKVLYSGADILILDEPTAVLTPQEVESFLEILQKLKKDGKTIILISHKLAEIKAVGDSCTIIRKGKVVDTVEVASVSERELANMMVGHEIHPVVNEKHDIKSKKILKLKNIEYTNEKGIKKIKDLSLTVNRGRILGIAGIDNNGQKELVDILTRIISPQKGEIIYYDYDKQENILKKSVREINQFIACIPEDRLKEGLVLEYDLAQNVVLKEYYRSKFSAYGFLKPKKIETYAEDICKNYDVRSSKGIHTPAGKLSGGNQQKLIVGREIELGTNIIIAFQPTRGVDVGAINFIHKKLIAQRDRGKAVILISMELTEILSLSDEVAVIHDGQIVEVADANELTREDVGLMMAGKRREE